MNSSERQKGVLRYYKTSITATGIRGSDATQPSLTWQTMLFVITFDSSHLYQ